MNPYPDDALDDLLARPAAACPDELRRSLLVETTSVLRRRYRRRRIILAAALATAAALLFGISGTMLFQQGRLPERETEAPGPVAVETSVPDAVAADAPAAAIERIGEISAPRQRAVLYRRAGDRYLDEEADPQDALRCYTQALDDGSEADLAVSADDSWLLMALKIDRTREKKNANRD